MQKLHTYVNAKIVFRVGDELLVFRNRSGEFHLPGGHLEHGEHPLQALQRELQEEMGYQLPADPVVIGAWTSVNDSEDLHRITITYLLDLSAKPEFQWLAVNSEERFEAFVWVPKGQIDTHAFNPGFRRLLHRAAEWPRKELKLSNKKKPPRA